MSDKVEERKELTEEEKKEVANVKIFQAFQMNLNLAKSLTMNMSARQLGRVFRALMAAPFEDKPKFKDVRENALFEAGMGIMDAKVLLVMEQKGAIEQALKDTRQEAQRLEKEGEKQNG